MAKATLRESDLYHPVKSFLENQGYEVKGEVGSCDVVARRGEEEPVIVELKTGFTLPLLFQGIRRQSLTDSVYLAVAMPERLPTLWRRHRRDILKLCRRLGLGLITVRLGNAPTLEVLLDPAPYRPRKDTRRRGLLLREFARRVGDPNRGGTAGRALVTAYRQDALRCASFLRESGPAKAANIKSETGVSRAPRILQRDVYGWFQRVARGTYALTPVGSRALDTYADVVTTLRR